MKTEMANLPGKCLHTCRHQFKLSTCKLAQDFVFNCYTHMSTSVIILVQTTLKQLMFTGDIQSNQTWPFCSQLDAKSEQLLSTPVFVSILLIMLIH